MSTSYGRRQQFIVMSHREASKGDSGQTLYKQYLHHDFIANKLAKAVAAGLYHQCCTLSVSAVVQSNRQSWVPRVDPQDTHITSCPTFERTRVHSRAKAIGVISTHQDAYPKTSLRLCLYGATPPLKPVAPQVFHLPFP